MKLSLFLLFIIFTQNVFAAADQWTPVENKITILQPLLTYGGGMLRVRTDTSSEAVNPAGCPSTSIYDLDFATGTEETRSATVSALYLAFASGKLIRLFISGDSCSSAGAPKILGVDVRNQW